MNALILSSIFSPGQIAGIVLICVLFAALLGLNGWLIYLLYKRGEHKLYTQQLQLQREALMEKLNAMRAGEDVDLSDMMGATEEEEESEEPLDEGDEDEEEAEPLEVAINDTGKVIRYNYSFTARITQAESDLKARYSELKNYILSFSGVKARMSWKKETFHIGRRNIACFIVRGKTLCICLATDPKLFEGTKYNVEDLSDKKTPMPCKYRVSGDRKTAWAKELIEIVMAGFGVAKNEQYEAQDFTLPYKSTEVLIKRRLIKVIGNGVPDFMKEDALAAANRIRYNRSFAARIIQSDDELKGYYSTLKNYILAHQDVRANDSWKKETFTQKRVTLALFVIRGKTLCLCLALDPKRYDGTKYKVEDLSVRTPKTKTPLLYRIKNGRRVNYAMQLLDEVFVDNGIKKIEREDENYAVPFVATETLIRRGLIKEVELSQKDSDFVNRNSKRAENEAAVSDEEFDEQTSESEDEE